MVSSAEVKKMIFPFSSSERGSHRHFTDTTTAGVLKATIDDLEATSYDAVDVITEANDDVTESWSINSLNYIFPVIAGIIINLEVVIVKRNPWLIDNLAEVLPWLYISGIIFSSIFMGIIENPVLPTNWLDFIYMSIHCIMFVFTWPLYMIACSYLSGNTLSMLHSMLVILMLIPQYTFLSDIYPGHRNWIEILGIILVLLGSILISMWELL